MVTDSSSPAPPPAVAIRELTRTFGDFTAIDRATADIAVGEVFGVIGPNGAGKNLHGRCREVFSQVPFYRIVRQMLPMP